MRRRVTAQQAAGDQELMSVTVHVFWISGFGSLPVWTMQMHKAPRPLATGLVNILYSVKFIETFINHCKVFLMSLQF